MALLATSHLADDINQSFIPALLPYLILERHLSHQTAGTLVLCQAMSSSVIQPAIGHLADRRSMPWLIAVGLLLAGGGVAALGVLPTMPMLFLAALISGIGVAMFHPEAARFANWVAGDQKASGMRWFTVGGNLGFAIGPAFATAAISLWGLHGTLAAAIPVALIAGVVLLELRRLSGFIPSHVKQRKSAGTDDWVSFGKLSAFVIVRSMAYLGSVAFLPLYFVEVLHTSPAAGDAALVAYLLSGAFGTVAGGPIADRVGRKPVMLWSTGLTVVLFVAFVALTHGGGPLPLALVLIVLTGFVLVASQASFVVLGQEFLPNRVGLASGVTLGLAVSLGGGLSPVLGAIADAHGVAASILTIAGLALAATLVAFTLPSENRRQPKPGNPSRASAA
ncbi:MAG TPA: MFS transporter [Candidatus Elarobacter sp.]|jgi:FSR family fosmidomycin resistance protein-like MFS transporter